MFHDPSLGRTTDSTGEIRNREWYGSDGMEHVRTIKEPKQSIPTFAETVTFLMKPENHHVKFDVDVKVQNDPDRLFKLMHAIISAQPDWEAVLAPRIMLGLWHPRFLGPAKEWLPYCRRSYIGPDPTTARKYFWNDCHAFSMSFASLTTADGYKFRQECKTAGKMLMVWTVNEPAHMMEAVRWEVNAIITDVTQTWLELRKELQEDYETVGSKYGRVFLWTTYRFYTPFQAAIVRMVRYYLESVGGPFDDSVGTPSMVATSA